MTIDYAHTPIATRQRAEKAKTVSRWCYHHGVTANLIAGTDHRGRRRLAQGAEVPPPQDAPEQLGETWQLVLELLAQRDVWDQAHQADPPVAPIDCLECLLEQGCESHRRGRACGVCRDPLHRVTLMEGYATHPTCHLGSTGAAALIADPHESDTPLY